MSMPFFAKSVHFRPKNTYAPRKQTESGHRISEFQKAYANSARYFYAEATTKSALPLDNPSPMYYNVGINIHARKKGAIL